MYTALKEKKRYVVFEIKSLDNFSKEEIRDGLNLFFLNFFGEYGFSKLGVKLLSYRNGVGLLKCSRDSLYEILGAMALIEEIRGKKARVIAKASSGTIKTLKERGFNF